MQRDGNDDASANPAEKPVESLLLARWTPGTGSARRTSEHLDPRRNGGCAAAPDFGSDSRHQSDLDAGRRPGHVRIGARRQVDAESLVAAGRRRRSRQPSDGQPESAEARLVASSGRFLAFEEQIRAIRLGRDASRDRGKRHRRMETRIRSGRFSTTPAVEREPSFSPDGRWLAYSSDESGRVEVYVRPFPGPGAAAPNLGRWWRHANVVPYPGSEIYLRLERTHHGRAVCGRGRCLSPDHATTLVRGPVSDERAESHVRPASRWRAIRARASDEPARRPPDVLLQLPGRTATNRPGRAETEPEVRHAVDGRRIAGQPARPRARRAGGAGYVVKG